VNGLWFSISNFLLDGSGNATLYMCLSEGGGTAAPGGAAPAPAVVDPYKNLQLKTSMDPYYAWASYNVQAGSCDPHAPYIGNVTIAVDNTTDQFGSAPCTPKTGQICVYTFSPAPYVTGLQLLRYGTQGAYYYQLEGSLLPQAQTYSSLPYRGANMAGFEFVPPLPPTLADLPYFARKGMNAIRYPVRWETIEPSIGTFDEGDLATIGQYIDVATHNGFYVLLDLHSYMRYYDNVVGQAGSPITAQNLADAWVKLATPYLTNDHVLLDLMNEPNTMATELVVADYNPVIAALRRAGAQNWLLIEGNGWSGMYSWTQNWYGTANGIAFAAVPPPPRIVDPLNHYLINVHEYFDAPGGGGGGGGDSCVDPSRMLAIENAQIFVDWLHANGLKAILSELGGKDIPNCLADISGLLTFLEQNDDVLVGWTVWVAGSQFTSPLDISPVNGQESAQMKAIAPHLTPLPAGPNPR